MVMRDVTAVGLELVTAAHLEIAGICDVPADRLDIDRLGLGNVLQHDVPAHGVGLDRSLDPGDIDVAGNGLDERIARDILYLEVPADELDLGAGRATKPDVAANRVDLAFPPIGATLTSPLTDLTSTAACSGIQIL